LIADCRLAGYLAIGGEGTLPRHLMLHNRLWISDAKGDADIA
jgi:hypothetical protein